MVKNLFGLTDRYSFECRYSHSFAYAIKVLSNSFVAVLYERLAKKRVLFVELV